MIFFDLTRDLLIFFFINPENNCYVVPCRSLYIYAHKFAQGIVLQLINSYLTYFIIYVVYDFYVLETFNKFLNRLIYILFSSTYRTFD